MRRPTHVCNYDERNYQHIRVCDLVPGDFFTTDRADRWVATDWNAVGGFVMGANLCTGNIRLFLATDSIERLSNPMYSETWQWRNDATTNLCDHD